MTLGYVHSNAGMVGEKEGQLAGDSIRVTYESVGAIREKAAQPAGDSIT